MKTALPWILLILATMALAFTAGARGLPITPDYEVKDVFVFGVLDDAAMGKVNAQMAGGWRVAHMDTASGGYIFILERPKR